jgi:hypothetical protein
LENTNTLTAGTLALHCGERRKPASASTRRQNKASRITLIELTKLYEESIGVEEVDGREGDPDTRYGISPGGG